MTARRQISIAECGLLTCRNAIAYCGQLGEERFDREVAPYCPPRFIGQERFYDRDDLDAWRKGLPIDRLGRTQQAEDDTDWQEKLRNDLSKDRRNQARPG
jgi:hypothetical protein